MDPQQEWNRLLMVLIMIEKALTSIFLLHFCVAVISALVGVVWLICYLSF